MKAIQRLRRPTSLGVDNNTIPQEIMGMVLKLERFSHLLDRSFGLSSFIGLRYLSKSWSLSRGLP